MSKKSPKIPTPPQAKINGVYRLYISDQDIEYSYIGISIDCNARIKKHLNEIKVHFNGPKLPNFILQMFLYSIPTSALYIKWVMFMLYYSKTPEDIKFEILDQTSSKNRHELEILEMKYIAKYDSEKNGFNGIWSKAIMYEAEQNFPSRKAGKRKHIKKLFDLQEKRNKITIKWLLANEPKLQKIKCFWLLFNLKIILAKYDKNNGFDDQHDVLKTMVNLWKDQKIKSLNKMKNKISSFLKNKTGIGYKYKFVWFKICNTILKNLMTNKFFLHKRLTQQFIDYWSIKYKSKNDVSIDIMDETFICWQIFAVEAKIEKLIKQTKVS